MKIFVSLASYRDSQLIPTVLDFMENESGNHEVTYGVCLQDTQEEYEMAKATLGPCGKVKIDFIDYREAQGVCHARKRLHEMVTDEDYFLQMDSHMRSIPGWDEALIQSLKLTRCEKPVLSAYPPHYCMDDLEKTYLESSRFMNVTCYHLPVKRSTTLHGCYPHYLNESGAPVRNPHISAGFHFAPAEWLNDAHYPDDIYWDGEEDQLTILSYTNGWTIFCPEKAMVYHSALNNLSESSEKYRPLHWEDHPDAANGENFRRFDLKSLSPGSARSLDDYFRELGQFTENFRFFEIAPDLVSNDRAESWILAFYDRLDNVIYRREIREQSVLKLQNRIVALGCDQKTLHRAYGYTVTLMVPDASAKPMALESSRFSFV